MKFSKLSALCMLIAIRSHAQFRPPMYLPPVLSDPNYSKKLNEIRTIKLASGKIEPLNTIKKINIKYDHQYKSVCSFTSEAEYIQNIRSKKSKAAANSKIEHWQSLPITVLEPNFMNGINRHIRRLNMEARNNDSVNAGATLVVKIMHEEPHVHRPRLEAQCSFFDQDGYFIARFNINAGGSLERCISQRIGECYYVAGHLLGKEILKTLRNALENPEPVVNNTLSYLNGDIRNLQGLKEVKIRYDYSKMEVGNFPSETDYLNHKTELLTPEDAEVFIKEWESYPQPFMEAPFEESFNHYATRFPLNTSKLTHETSADTTLLIEIISIDPNTSTSAVSGFARLKCSFITAAGNTLLDYEIALGLPKENETSLQLSAAFSTAAQLLAKDLMERKTLLNKK